MMPDLNYEVETIDPCPICKKQVSSKFSHNGDITLSINCNNCGVKMEEKIGDGKEGLPLSFISGVVNSYASLIRRWNRRAK